MLREYSYDLKLHSLAIEFDRADFLEMLVFCREERRVGSYEVHTDGRDVTLGVGVISESQKQAGLSDSRVSDKE